MDTLGERTMRDTKAYWQDIHDQAENVIYKSHGDSGWLWMFELRTCLVSAESGRIVENRLRSLSCQIIQAIFLERNLR